MTIDRDRHRGMPSRRGLRLLAVLLLLPLATTLALPVTGAAKAPRTGAAPATVTDSLWFPQSDTARLFGVCADPSSPAALASCFGTTISTDGADVLAMATDGVNVYFAGSGFGGLSCPIADLGASCTRIMAGGWGSGGGTLAIAAAGGQLWIGQANGQIYRCPADLPYVEQTTMPAACTLLDSAVTRPVDSLLIAGTTLYAGLGGSGTSSKNTGILWSCPAYTANACTNLDTYGNAQANAMVAAGGALWVGLSNGILWRCDPVQPDSCAVWMSKSNVTSVAYDGVGTVYAAAGDSETIWACPVGSTTASTCPDATTWNTDGQINAVAAGAAGLFYSSVIGVQGGSQYPRLYFGTAGFTQTGAHAWDNSISDGTSLLLYIPAGGPAGVGGVRLQVNAETFGQKLRARCARAPQTPRATVTVEGPYGMSKTFGLRVCRLRDGTTVRKRLDLLDPGTYTVTIRAGTHVAERTFTIEQGRTKNIGVTLRRKLG